MFIATSGTMGYGNGHPLLNKVLTPDLFDLIVNYYRSYWEYYFEGEMNDKFNR